MLHTGMDVLYGLTLEGRSEEALFLMNLLRHLPLGIQSHDDFAKWVDQDLAWAVDDAPEALKAQVWDWKVTRVGHFVASAAQVVGVSVSTARRYARLVAR